MKHLTIITLILLILFPQLTQAQEYDFLNAFIEDKIPSAFTENAFVPLLRDTLKYGGVTEQFLREQWEPIKTEKIPDIKVVLAGVSLEHLTLFLNRMDRSEIDFSKLKGKIQLVENVKDHLENGKSICRLSMPFISCSKEWAVIFLSCYSKIADGGGRVVCL